MKLNGQELLRELPRDRKGKAQWQKPAPPPVDFTSYPAVPVIGRADIGLEERRKAKLEQQLQEARAVRAFITFHLHPDRRLLKIRVRRGMTLGRMRRQRLENSKVAGNNTVRAAVIQMDCRIKDKAHNLEKAIGFLRKLRDGTDIACFPELFTTGYNLNLIGDKFYELAETIPGCTTDLLAEKAKKKKLAILGNIVEKERGSGSRLYDTAFAIDREGKLAGKYRKYYLYPTEHRFFRPGKEISVVDLGLAKAGMAICFDHAFPELFRVLGLKGAQLVFVPSAVPLGYEYLLNLRTRARAQDNQFFVLAANRVGQEGKIRYCGSSKIVAPKGDVLAEASRQKEQIIYGTLDLSKIASERSQEPVMRSLRREIYGQTFDLL